MKIVDSNWGPGLLEALQDGGGDHPATVKDIQGLNEQSRQLVDARLLCDPEDEFGQLLPSFQYDYVEFESIDRMESPEPQAVRQRRTKPQDSDIEVQYTKGD
ncbi:hypothetical protein ColTof4_03076 [Colletotrichum tofieldiae]|nr:hypothetical protein ColTof3_13519 [Colletotrichum tofieldiae]GKT70653.1 hypothetical protein ColTof4_03076 [Colletotrichum tofieldiae]GKT94457.1 hypothetical protein Ct61P_12307 [Colletotrichum tofieldiae]